MGYDYVRSFLRLKQESKNVNSKSKSFPAMCTYMLVLHGV